MKKSELSPENFLIHLFFLKKWSYQRCSSLAASMLSHTITHDKKGVNHDDEQTWTIGAAGMCQLWWRHVLSLRQAVQAQTGRADMPILHGVGVAAWPCTHGAIPERRNRRPQTMPAMRRTFYADRQETTALPCMRHPTQAGADSGTCAAAQKQDLNVTLYADYRTF